MNDWSEEINNISKIVRGKEIYLRNHNSYGEDINDLLSTIGMEGFFVRASNLAKSELLACANKSNFLSLCGLLNGNELIDIISVASIEDFRSILNKILATPEAHNLFFKDNFLSLVNGLSEEKNILFKGFLKKIEEQIDGRKKVSINIDDLINEKSKLQSDNDRLKSAYEDAISNLNEKIKSLEKKNAEIIQDRIDKNLSIYVQNSVAELNKIENKLNSAAARWSFFSILILFSGFSAGIGFALFGYLFGPKLDDLKWPELLIFSVKGIFIVSAFVAAAGYSFLKSNAFTHEAIIVSNRAHAIKFGKLYLEIYGNTVERSEMQKIFENWNISSDTAFLKNKNDRSDSVKFSEFLDSLKKVKELIPGVGKE